jgi:hypothetical protein
MIKNEYLTNLRPLGRAYVRPQGDRMVWRNQQTLRQISNKYFVNPHYSYTSSYLNKPNTNEEKNI